MFPGDCERSQAMSSGLLNPERHSSCPFTLTFLTGLFKVDLRSKEALLDFLVPQSMLCQS